MRLNIIFGGKAGQGPNFLSEIVANGLIEHGYYVFYSRDYQSLIRGGHNFNALTVSDKEVYSNDSKVNLLVCLDENTKNMHKDSLAKKGIIIDFVNGKGNMYYAGAVFKLLGVDFKILENSLDKLKNFNENIRDAREGFNKEKRNNFALKKFEKKNLSFMNGSQAIAKGAIKSGLEYYYAYPMTPATPLMMELGQMTLDKSNKHKVIEMENEISVILTAIGSSSVGGISMVGTSGGGFDLMTESLSMAGMTEIPIVIYLSSRPGPSTGVATYTSQADLNLALKAGHGEFSRVVIAPGTPDEAIEATNNCFYLSQEFRIPCILLGDKHLGEAKNMTNEDAKLLEFNKAIINPERFNSYESDKTRDNIATEDAKVTIKNFEARMKKHAEIEKECSKFERIKIYVNKNSKNLILGWGSTKGAILDALAEGKIDAKFVQVIFMEPFPAKELKNEIKKAKKVVLVENNATGQLAGLIAEKTGFIIEDKNKILRYDGRPFFADELADEIRRRLK